MKTPARSLMLMLAAGAFLPGACQSMEQSASATLATADEETMARLKSVLADAMNTARIDLGPGDLTKTSTISVLPPRPSQAEGRSMARPTLFDIVLNGSACFVVRRDTGEAYALQGVSCRVLSD